jgi:adenylate cyclase, class 2
MTNEFRVARERQIHSSFGFRHSIVIRSFVLRHFLSYHTRSKIDRWSEGAMQYEVEQKFPLDDRSAVERTLEGLGCRWNAPVDQADLYFAHPARDFRSTDEALRLRRSGSETMITYKGPKLDAATKTRREIELPIAGPHGFDRYRELLIALGFREVRLVEKRRRPGTLAWQGAEIHIALDEVDGLGAFLEIELQAASDELDHARALLTSLAAQLALTRSERRSYLELLENSSLEA